MAGMAHRTRNRDFSSGFQKINTKCKGIYAISVSGTLPRDIAADLKAMRVRYRPNMRDKSQK